MRKERKGDGEGGMTDRQTGCRVFGIPEERIRSKIVYILYRPVTCIRTTLSHVNIDSFPFESVGEKRRLLYCSLYYAGGKCPPVVVMPTRLVLLSLTLLIETAVKFCTVGGMSSQGMFSVLCPRLGL